MPPPPKFSFFKCWWEYQILGGNSPPLYSPPPSLNTPETKNNSTLQTKKQPAHCKQKNNSTLQTKTDARKMSITLVIDLMASHLLFEMKVGPTVDYYGRSNLQPNAVTILKYK